MITVRQMTIFAAAARHGSFRACAEQMGLSQVVVSAHVRQLESELGTVLFDRRPGVSAVLTEAGKRALGRITAILAELGDLRQEFAGEQGRRTITIATYGFIMLRVQDQLDAFRRAHPHVDLQISLSPPDNRTLCEQVQRGEIDLGCFFTLDPDEVPGSALVRTEELAIYAGEHHPLVDDPEVTGAALGGFPAVALCAGNPQRTLTDRALASIGAAHAGIMLETDALGLMLHNVRRQEAWICLFSKSVDDGVPGLKRLRLEKELPPVEVRLVSRPSIRHDSLLDAVRACFYLDPQSGSPPPSASA